MKIFSRVYAHFHIHSQDFTSLLHEDGGTAECAYVRRVSDLCLDTNNNWIHLRRHSYTMETKVESTASDHRKMALECQSLLALEMIAATVQTT